MVIITHPMLTRVILKPIRHVSEGKLEQVIVRDRTTSFALKAHFSGGHQDIPGLVDWSKWLWKLCILKLAQGMEFGHLFSLLINYKSVSCYISFPKVSRFPLSTVNELVYQVSTTLAKGSIWWGKLLAEVRTFSFLILLDIKSTVWSTPSGCFPPPTVQGYIYLWPRLLGVVFVLRQGFIIYLWLAQN